MASYPVPALEGRDWKYLLTGLPLASVKDWPMSEDPAGLPSAPVISDLPSSPGTWAAATMASG